MCSRPRLLFLFLLTVQKKKPIQIGNLNCPSRAKMFGLVDYHVVTDTISLVSIPGEGVGRSGALPGISSSSSHGTQCIDSTTHRQKG